MLQEKHNIRTAISIRKNLLDHASIIARELEVSRNRLFVMAIEDFIKKYNNQNMLDAINAAHDDIPDAEEQKLHHNMLKTHRRLIENQW